MSSCPRYDADWWRHQTSLIYDVIRDHQNMICYFRRSHDHPMRGSQLVVIAWYLSLVWRGLIAEYRRIVPMSTHELRNFKNDWVVLKMNEYLMYQLLYQMDQMLGYGCNVMGLLLSLWRVSFVCAYDHWFLIWYKWNIEVWHMTCISHRDGLLPVK